MKYFVMFMAVLLGWAYYTAAQDISKSQEAVKQVVQEDTQGIPHEVGLEVPKIVRSFISAGSAPVVTAAFTNVLDSIQTLIVAMVSNAAQRLSTPTRAFLAQSFQTLAQFVDKLSDDPMEAAQQLSSLATDPEFKAINELAQILSMYLPMVIMQNQDALKETFAQSGKQFIVESLKKIRGALISISQ